MSVIPEVKCRRCGESFSALRSRCPNCGTRRVTQSARTPGTTPSTVKGTASYERAETNTKWQIIFGLILVAAVILAVIVMVTAIQLSLMNCANDIFLLEFIYAASAESISSLFVMLIVLFRMKYSSRSDFGTAKEK